jgi:8-oxo-dGTP pyrophosphatase MutT (NUDIX family)
MASSSSSSNRSNNRLYHRNPSSTTTACAGKEDSSTTTSTTALMLPDSWLTTDHYNGITVHLPLEEEDSSTTALGYSFAIRLENSLNEWKQQGTIKGIWLHIPHHHADKIATAVQAGFEFHSVQETISQQQQQPNSANTVSNNDDSNNKNTSILILKRWLPETIPNRLPHGPTHQIGVGCVVFHPHDPTLLLCVQEQTGPAAAYGLWKLPTGLADPHEDVHVAALRELREETGLHQGVTFRGMLQARQAHPNAVLVPPPCSTSNNSNEPANSAVNNTQQQQQQLRRSVSDLFFVCWLQLPETFSPEDISQCPDEIAAIQWMSVQDYCQQERWQDAPVYQELNRVIWKLSQQQQQQQQRMDKHGDGDDNVGLLQAYTLPLGFGRGMNTLYHAAGPSTSAPAATSKDSSLPAPKSQL